MDLVKDVGMQIFVLCFRIYSLNLDIDALMERI